MKTRTKQKKRKTGILRLIEIAGTRKWWLIASMIIAVVRAVLKDAPIIVLDEATAYADPENESNILAAFSHLIRGRVGASGSGKTTLTRLIARFWDVNAGEIRIGGKNIKAYTTGHLLANISMVFQDVYLFNETIFNNIRIGRPGATKDYWSWFVTLGRESYCGSCDLR